MNKFTALILAILMTLLACGCSPVGMLGSGAATTMVIAEDDRSAGNVIDDATIKVNIASKFISSDDNLFININSTVLEGRVLLTGLVENQEIRIDAVRIVWETKGVKEVINETTVVLEDPPTIKDPATPTSSFGGEIASDALSSMTKLSLPLMVA